MGYFVDLKNISIADYKNKLKNGYLVPSRQILKENIEFNFSLIAKHSISNADDLLSSLKTKSKVEKFAEETGIDLDYLVILAREIKSYRPAPVKLKDFPGIDQNLLEQLNKTNIRNSAELYESAFTQNKMKSLASNTGLPINSLKKLVKLCDLTRIRWVNHTFANVLYEAGFTSVKEVSSADFEEVHQKIKKLNDEKELYKGNIGLNDMKLCVDLAKELPFEIDF